MTTFEDLKLAPDLLKVIERLGFVEPTSIQSKCIPEIKAGHDVVGQSLTGSGKTAAFGLPIVEKVTHGNGLQVLILTPTRELCVQVCDNLAEFGRFKHLSVVGVYGGVGIGPQIDGLRSADIVVGTPGRILDHLDRRTINIGNIKFLVIDEADKMFEMGFIEDVEHIIKYTPKERQTLLFGATISSRVHDLVRKHLKFPVLIKDKIYVDRSLLRQVYYDVKPYDKFSMLVHLIKNKTPGLAIVFCSTRREVDIITKNLKLQGIHVMAIHGGLSQNRRLHAVNSLKKENIQVLVATDVAARGLHIQNISHIYNYDVPKTSGEYIHRIGRTARAGNSGDAVTLLTERDHDNFRRVLEDKTLHIEKAAIPSFERVSFMRETHRQDHLQHHERRSFGPRRFSSPRHRR